jgi:hypothetical protein
MVWAAQALKADQQPPPTQLIQQFIKASYGHKKSRSRLGKVRVRIIITIVLLVIHLVLDIVMAMQPPVVRDCLLLFVEMTMNRRQLRQFRSRARHGYF